jgi:hypothetical protein
VETAMKNMRLTGFISLALAWTAAGAAEFDGSAPLICASMEIIECLPAEDCLRVTPEAVNAPQFIRIDFEANQIDTASASGARKTSPIERSEMVDGKLILQGAEDGAEGVRDGLGWSLAIAEDTGKMVLTGSGDAVGFVIFGACVPL